MEAKTTYLQIIQGVINRLANNSFLLKGWSITLVSVIVALGANNSEKIFMLLAFFPGLAFWILDGYFLSQEKRYRNLYELVAKMDVSSIDFTLDTKQVGDFSNSWARVLFSRTLLIFHGIIASSILFVLFLTR